MVCNPKKRWQAVRENHGKAANAQQAVWCAVKGAVQQAGAVAAGKKNGEHGRQLAGGAGGRREAGSSGEVQAAGTAGSRQRGSGRKAQAGVAATRTQVRTNHVYRQSHHATRKENKV